MALPVEIIEKILQEIVRILGDRAKPTLLALGKLNRTWSILSRPHLLNVLVLKGENDTVKLIHLMTAPLSTFPHPIRCEHFVFKSFTMGAAGISALQGIVGSVITPTYLEIHAVHGGIHRATIRLFSLWANLRHLGISGGTHTPSTFFNHLAAFPQLESLRLHNFRFSTTNDSPQTQYSFPRCITRLSLSQSSIVWVFLGSHVIPGGGFDGVHELSIRAHFCYQVQGVREMVACFRELRHVRTLELDALYNTTCPDLRPTMNRIFQSRAMPPLRIRGLKNLRLNFTRVPAEFAFGFLIMTTIHLPHIDTDLAVDITLPQPLGLWDNTDPEAQLRQMLVETCPDNTPDLNLASSITVRGFPGSLPDDVQKTGSARICGYPVTFADHEASIAGAQA